MQASERELCARLNTLALLLLRGPQAGASPPPSRKGKGKQKAAAAAGAQLRFQSLCLQY